MSLDDELRAALHDLIPARQTRPGLAERVESLARARRRRRMAVAGAAIAVAATCILGVFVAAPFTWTAQPDPASPPPVSRATPYLLLSSSVLPSGGGELGMIVANPGSTSLMYGVSGKVERWDGGRWAPYKVFVGSWSDMPGLGRLFSPGENYGVLDIGFNAGSRGYGAALWVRTGVLMPGYYRFVVPVRLSTWPPPTSPLASNGAMRPDTPPAATAVLEVRAGEASAVALRQPGPRYLTLDDEPVPAGRARRVTVAVDNVSGDALSHDVLPRQVELRRLQAGTWMPVSGLQVSVPAPPPGIPVTTFAVQLPALAPGVYEMVAVGTSVGNVGGTFWVVAPLT